MPNASLAELVEEQARRENEERIRQEKERVLCYGRKNIKNDWRRSNKRVKIKRSKALQDQEEQSASRSRGASAPTAERMNSEYGRRRNAYFKKKKKRSSKTGAGITSASNPREATAFCGDGAKMARKKRTSASRRGRAGVSCKKKAAIEEEKGPKKCRKNQEESYNNRL